MKNTTLVIVAAALTGALLLASVYGRKPDMTETSDRPPQAQSDVPQGDIERLELATFGSGCFWCTEAIFQHVKGVHSVVSGYSGGDVENPTYEQVCSGRTGHAEVVQITFDPELVSYDELLEVFWRTHDPTTLNRQGNDVGTQYRSAIFHHSDAQRDTAEKYKQQLDESGAFTDPIVTEITPYRNFYPAEDYHQNYFELNARQPYCTMVIRPKLEKFKKAFADKLKGSASAEPAPASGGKP